MTTDLIYHMLENGWEVNLEHIEKLKSGNKNDPSNKFMSYDVDLLALMEGLHNGKNHLIARVENEVFTAAIEGKRLRLYRKEPTWKKLGNYPIGQIKLIENGFAHNKKVGIFNNVVEVIVNKGENEDD